MRTDGLWFKDEQGRTRILRGVNLSGSTKVPYTPYGATYRREHFYDHRNVSFVGRPFPLAEADEHFTRLSQWGLTFLRFLITWEAVEHAGPGQYDHDYLDYLYAVIRKAGDYGIQCFIDPHQDVWSRWTGGDGAPGWTLEAVGFDLSRLDQTGAAITHQNHGDPFPRMIWPTNYTKLGAGTMFTLFFAGNDFAPKTLIDGIPVQEYLQGHYINAIKQVALKLKDLSNVVGYDSMNEPSGAWIGVKDVNELAPSLLLIGDTPTPYQAMLAGAGYPQTVDIYDLTLAGPQVIAQTTINPEGLRAWREGYDCVWKQNGVWTDEGGTPRLLRPAHFTRADGRPIDVANDYIKPFIVRFANEIRRVLPDTLIFFEAVPGSTHPHWGPDDPPHAVNAAHWYDGLALFMKMFNPELTIDFGTGQPIQGRAEVAQNFIEQIARQKLDSVPTVIGEFGIPFDLDEKASYHTGDFSTQTYALDLYYDAMDANALSCTIWNYTPDNSNARGDGWNDEDLSIYSPDQRLNPNNPNSGGRALDAIVRPYPQAIAGELIRFAFDLETRVFTLEYRPDTNLTAPTEIFVPNYQYREGYQVEISNGAFISDLHRQIVTVTSATDSTTQTIRISPL